jgi:hypothetical protein
LTTAAEMATAAELATAAETASEARADLPAVRPEAFYQGMLVRHPDYGLGKVVALSGSDVLRKATIAFASGEGSGFVSSKTDCSRRSQLAQQHRLNRTYFVYPKIAQLKMAACGDGLPSGLELPVDDSILSAAMVRRWPSR